MTNIRIIEVGPRDGLQHEKTAIPTDAKLALIKRLVEAGLKEIEATSFVSPKWVPQLGDAAELWPQLPAGALYSALVPNARGLERAIEVGVKRIAVFTAASDAFTQKNINMSVDQSIDVFQSVVEEFREKVPDGWVRGYVSTAFECPYAGRIQPQKVVRVCQRLIAIGVDELSIGDTIGVAAPKEVRILTKAIQDVAPVEKIAYHFHDTRGTAIANVDAALEMGITAFDSSAGGLGGCPYAPGAAGNLATEDLLYLLHGLGIETGVNLAKVVEATSFIAGFLGHAPTSKYWQAATARG